MYKKSKAHEHKHGLSPLKEIPPNTNSESLTRTENQNGGMYGKFCLFLSMGALQIRAAERLRVRTSVNVRANALMYFLSVWHC